MAKLSVGPLRLAKVERIRKGEVQSSSKNARLSIG